MNGKIYLGGPICGGTYKGVNSWREDMEKFFKDHEVETLSPMRGQFYLKDYREMPDVDESGFLSNMKTATNRDRNDIIQADIVLFNFSEAQKISAGSCIEIGWADAYRKPIIAIMNPDDHHYHGLIREMAMVVPDTDSAKQLALQILNK